MQKSVRTTSQHSRKSWATRRSIALVLSTLLASACGQVVQLTPAETDLVKRYEFDPLVAESLKRVVHSSIEPYRESPSIKEKQALTQAIKVGQTDGERGELLAQSMSGSAENVVTGLQARVSSGTKDDTAKAWASEVQQALPAGYRATFVSNDSSRAIVITKQN
jgi:hypothetical protein